MLTGLACLPCLPCATGCATGESTPPTEAVTVAPLLVRSPAPWKAGLGELDDVTPELRVAFADAHGFEVLPPPGGHAWRTLRPEPPQTIAEFRDFGANTRVAPRDRIALLPLGEYPLDVMVEDNFVSLVRTPDLSAIAATLAAFFATPVDLLPCRPFPREQVASRRLARHAQYDARALLDRVAPGLPRDAHSMLTLVNVDLFVWSEQQYAFGWSTLRDRLGVVGFSRLDPSVHGGVAPDDVPGTLLRRGLRVAVHEVGHMFGLGHCQAFRCAMNGIADLVELDATPLRLCPLCLRKLHIVTGLDPRARDAELLRVFARLGLGEEERWLAARADWLWRARSMHASAREP